MSWDRSVYRDVGFWSNSDHFSNDSFDAPGQRDGQDGSLYTDFTHDWPDPRRTPSLMDMNVRRNNSHRNNFHINNSHRWQNEQSNWQEGGGRNWFGSEGPNRMFGNGGFHDGQVEEGFNHQEWNNWCPNSNGWKNDDEFLRPQSTGGQRPSRSRNLWGEEPDPSFTERGRQNNQWQNLTKQFGSSHFHREGADNCEKRFSGDGRTLQADSSGLDDSGGGRKRPRSLDRSGKLSKSSRAEKSATRNYDISSPSRSSSVSDLNVSEVQKPDSTSKQDKAKKSQTMTGKGINSVSGPGSKAGAVGLKKKHPVSKHKAPSSSVSVSNTTVEVPKAAESDGGISSEGVLERAERICKELREKRKQIVPSRASLSAQRVGALRSVLNTSIHRFNLAHKSFLRGYMSDSNSTPSKSAAEDSTSASASQKKHFSSSTSSEIELPTRSEGSTPVNVDSGADAAASSSSRNSHLQGNDIDRIRHSIERSVMAEGKARRTSVRERSSSGSRSPAVSVSSSAVHLPGISSVTESASSVSNKPPRPLSKDAISKMVNAPQSRTQRLQLARMLRQHSAVTVARPRHIQLDGLYDNDDSDSIGEVLKNISGLEEIGECAELKNIKLEDLTNEDKLRIAQMIEEADSTSRTPHMDITEVGEEMPVQQRSRPPRHTRVQSSEVNSGETESSNVKPRSRSPRRVQTPSPSPSRPLSLDDLNTDDRAKQGGAAGAVSFQHRSVDPHSTPATVSSLQSGSPARQSGSPARQSGSPARQPNTHSSPGPSRTHSSSPGPSRTHSLSPQRSVEGVVSDDMDSVEHQAKGSTVRDHSSERSLAAPMDVSDPPTSSIPATGSLSAEEAGALQEVVGLSQRQDSILSEMRVIDNDLCAMYKSLIEIVARMSGLQRRRVQLQSEGEQLSQRRNSLLIGLCPNAAVTVDKGLRSTSEDRQWHPSSGSATPQAAMDPALENVEHSTRKSSDRAEAGQAASGSTGAYPSWLSAATSSGRQVPTSRRGSAQETTPSSSADQGLDIGLSGSVTSSEGSTVPHALSRSSALKTSADSVREVPSRMSKALSAKPPTPDTGDRAGRVMLSINGAADSSIDRDVTVSSVSSVSTEVGHPVVRNRMGADSSSGIGSSVSAQSNLRKSIASPLSDSGLHQNLSSTQSSQEEESKSVQPAESSRLVIHSFASPKPSCVSNSQGQNISQPKSPGVSVAYLGALSSDLVQEIVRNLPLTSQLGEVNKPSMYVVRPGTAAMEVSSENQSQEAGVKSVTVEDPAAKLRTRTTSVHSVSSDVSSGEQTLPASIPPLKLYDLDKAGSKTCTPRSESDTHSVTSGTSLGEQIKLFSERNSFSQDGTSNPSSLSFVETHPEDKDSKTGHSIQNMHDCSVLLERLDMDNITIVPDSWRAEDDSDKRKKRKSRKDRDQSLQRRRCYVNESSSEGEDGEMTPVGDGYPSLRSPAQQCSSRAASEEEEKMEADSGPEGEELDSTLKGGREQEALSSEEVGASHSASSTVHSVSASRLKLNPENLKAFRANVRRNLASPPSSESGVEAAGRRPAAEERAASKECVKIAGPSAPVTGLCVHNNLLYACFQRIGVHSYTLKGELSAEYPVADTQCFTITPVGSGSQHYLAVGCADHLTFLSISDQSVVSSLDTVVKVMCMQVVDTSLFAGLDSGAIIVISLTTLQETRRFQASDCAVQCMSWTREGSTRLLAVASQDANIHVIDASNGLPVRMISGHTKTAFTLHMLDHFVLSGSGDRKVMAHNVHNASLIWELHDHKGIVNSICVDNGLLFTAGYDKIIRCYDLKSRKLLHLMYGAGKCIIMKMAVHNSVLYTGNRDGEVEAIDLRDMGSFACECVSCTAVYGLKEHLWHHLVADHLLPNTQAMRCPWSDCSVMLDTRSAPVKAGEHLRRHIDGDQLLAPPGP